MQYDPPQEEKDIEDNKFTWICSGCQSYMHTAKDIKPEKCDQCGADSLFIQKYHIF